MSESQNWRTGIDASDYFGSQKKQLQVADRRPVIRRAADLVGPGINSSAVPIKDFSSLLATYNGYYSAVSAANAPIPSDSSTPEEEYVGYVAMDSDLGGEQVFTELNSGDVYRRVFLRAPMSPESIAWGPWVWVPTVLPSIARPVTTNTESVPPSTPTKLPSVSVLSGVNLDRAFSSDDGGRDIYVYEPGSYTGIVEVSGPDDGTVWEATVDHPYLDTVSSFDMGGAVPRERAPIQFVKTDTDAAAISVTLTHDEAGNRLFTWRLTLTRMGAA